MVAGLGLAGNQVTLTWIDPTPVNYQTQTNFGNPSNEIGFWIERAPLQGGVVGAYTVIGTAIANATTYTDSTIVAGQAYSYRVGAYNVEGAAFNADGTVTYSPVYSTPWYVVNPVSVATATPAGAYTTGTQITIDVVFSDLVNVTAGQPQLLLNNGAAALYDPSKNVANSNHMVFTYLVAAGQDISRLDYLSVAAILPGGAQIQTLAGNSAIVTLPAPASAADGLFAANIMVDTTNPVISYTIAPPVGPTGWYNSITTAPTVTFSATDNLSGVASLTAPVTLGEGVGQTVTGTAVDGAGNSASITTTPINVDLTAPVTTAVLSGTLGNNNWYTTAVTVNLSATDATSGVATTYYSTDNVTFTVGNSVTISAQGSSTVYYFSVDLAGNQEVLGSVPIKIDTVAPVTTATVSGTLGNNNWYTTAVTVNLSAADATSGVATIYYSTDNVTFTVGNSVTISAQGSSTVYYFSVDLAGNQEPHGSVSFKIDTVAPLTTATVSGTLGNNNWYTTAVTVNLSATDATSGVATTYYSTDNVTFTVGNSVTISAQGSSTVYYFSVDLAGNQEAHGSVSFKIDTVAPTVTGVADIKTGPLDSTGATVSYSGTVTDLTSGPGPLVFTPPSGTHFPVGVTTVGYTATESPATPRPGLSRSP